MLRLVETRARARILQFSATAKRSSIQTAVRHATCFAWDCSGSTLGQPVYHDLTAKIFKEVKDASGRGDNSLRIVAWHSSRDEVTEVELLRRTSDREGRDGTEPRLIATWVNENDFKGRLVIVTDGQVTQCDVEAADALIGSRAFERVDVHLLETGTYGPCNMSVPAAFVRQSPHTTLHYMARERGPGGALPVPTVVANVTRDDMSILDRLPEAITTPEQFLEKLAVIKAAVIARTMGKTGDPSVRDALLALKRRLVATEAAEATRSDAVTTLQTALSDGKTDEAVAAAASILRAHHAQLNGLDDAAEAANWRLQIDRLVSMCEGALMGVFDLSGVKAAVAGDRWRRAAPVAAPPAADPAADPAAATSDSDAASDIASDDDYSGYDSPPENYRGWSDADAVFQCPTTPAQPSDLAILVKTGACCVLEDEPHHVTNDVFDCPLNLLKYDHLVEKLVSRLDHPVSLRSMQDAEAAGSPLVRSPTTRKMVVGALCLGESLEHCEASRWTLAQAVMHGKLIGNDDLWTAVIWLLVENGVKGTGHLLPALPQLRQQMVYRLKNHMTSISMSGLPELPTALVSLGAAVWFVLAQPAISTALKTGGGDQARTAHDALRAHISHVEHLESLLGLTGYALPPGCKDHIAKVRATLAMLGYVKGYEADVFSGRTALPAAMRALYQGAERVDREKLGADVRARMQLVDWVAVDGAATSEQQAAVKATLPAACHGIDARELYAMGHTLEQGQAAGDVDVPFPLTAPALPEPAVNWPAYAAKHDGHAAKSTRVPICPATCRPFYDVGGATWKEAATAKWGAEPSNLISLPAMFARFVCAFERYPTTGDEFILYLQERYSNMKADSRRDTLPANIRCMVQDCLASFEALTATIEPAEFKRRARASVDVTKRRVMETEWRANGSASASGTATTTNDAAAGTPTASTKLAHTTTSSRLPTELADAAASALTELYQERRIDAATLMQQLKSLPSLGYSLPGSVAEALVSQEGAKKTPPAEVVDMLLTLVPYTGDTYGCASASSLFSGVRKHRELLDTSYYLALVRGLGGGKMA